MNIISPINFQVFQRSNKEIGYIRLTIEDTENVYIKISGNDLYNNPIECDWYLVESEDNYIDTDLEWSAGGWYKFEIKTDNEYYSIENVGIGEVIIGAGQSNSTNSGEERTNTETGMVATTDGIEWRLANDPMLGCHDMVSGAEACDNGSFYPSLGDELYKEFNVPIGIASCGYGATAVEHWLPDATPVKWDNELFKIVECNDDINLFDYLLDRMSQLGMKGFRCVLWHQGESDYETPEYKYYSRLYKIIVESQKQAGWFVPWIVAIASYGIVDFENSIIKMNYNVREAQKRLIKDKIAIEGPDTDLLGPEYRDKTGVHFNPKGLKKHGKLWAGYVSDYIHKVIDM